MMKAHKNNIKSVANFTIPINFKSSKSKLNSKQPKITKQLVRMNWLLRIPN